MMRSLFTGVAGLTNHQTRMDVVGNNIANVNTPGYKASRVTFADALSQTLQGASASTGNVGGTNPKQIGLGMSVASIDTLFTDGSTQATGKQTDLALSGTGFFIVSDGNNQYYTRNGTFDFDEQGNYVVPGTGLKVMGYVADSNGVIDTTQPVGAVTIPLGATMAPSATTGLTFSSNIDGRLTAGSTLQTSIDVYDSLGAAHSITQTFYKVGNNTWLTSTAVVDGSGTVSNALKEVTFTPEGQYVGTREATLPANFADIAISAFNYAAATGSTQSFTLPLMDNSLMKHNLQVQITSTGAGYSMKISENGTVLNTYTAAPATISVNGTTFNLNWGGITGAPASTTPTVSPQSLAGYTTGATVNASVITTTNGSNPITIMPDFSKVTQFDGDSTLKRSQNGYTAGALDTGKITVDQTGTIIGTFSNGRTQALGQVALASFNNPAGLMRLGDTLFGYSVNSGTATVGVAGKGGFGKISAGSLEMSNVNLSQEFSNMIVTQRGFQANSKIITVSDEMLETLVNLKR